jgi:hypothetical protein
VIPKDSIVYSIGKTQGERFGGRGKCIETRIEPQSFTEERGVVVTYPFLTPGIIMEIKVLYTPFVVKFLRVTY